MPRHRTQVYALLVVGFLVVAGGILAQPNFADWFAQPTGTPTRTLTPEPTQAPEPTETPTPSPSPTLVPTATPAARTIRVGSKPNAIVMDPSGSRLYVSDENGLIRVVSAGTLRPLVDIRTDNATLSWLVIHPSGDRLYATALDGAVLAIDLARSEVVARARLNSTYPVVRPIAISPDGARLYISEASDRNLGMISLESRGLGLIARFGDARDPRLAAVNQPGNRLFVPNYGDNLVSVYSVSSQFGFFPALTAKVPLSGSPTSAVLNRDGSLLYVTLGDTPGIVVINTQTLAIQRAITMPTNLFGAVLTPDGRRLVATSNISDHAYVVDTASNQMIASYFIGQGPRGIAIAPDSRTVYVANYLDGTISVFATP